MEDNSSPFVITIGRQTGSGGRQIGKAIAQHFGIAYYDKTVLSQAAEDTGLGRNVFHNTGDRKGFLRQFIGAVQPFIGGGDFYASPLSDDNIFSLQSGVIRKLAADHSCVIVGRAADHILKEHPRCVKIFLAAKTEEKARRVMDENKIDYKSALRTMNHNDEQRASYYNFYADGTWGNADTYDLCINISSLGYEGTLSFLINFISAKLNLPDPLENTPPIRGVY